MYDEFFGFEEAPFRVTPDHEFIYYSEKHFEALSQMLYGVQERKGFVVVSGPVGSGKTTLSRAFLQEVDEDTSTALVLNSRMNSDELLHAIADDFGLEPPDDPSAKDLIDELNDFLLSEFNEGRNVCVIIDESQNLSPEALENLRLLSNLETEKHKLLQIVLVGQPEMNELLEREELRQLRQRINVWVNLTNLTREETENYVQHRLDVAGRSDISIDEAAYDLIYEKSKGNPRAINLICDRTFLAAYVDDEEEIKKRHVEKALENLSVQIQKPDELGGDDARVLKRIDESTEESPGFSETLRELVPDEFRLRRSLIVAATVLVAVVLAVSAVWNYRAESSRSGESVNPSVEKPAEDSASNSKDGNETVAGNDSSPDNEPESTRPNNTAPETLPNALNIEPLKAAPGGLSRHKLASLVLARFMSFKASHHTESAQERIDLRTPIDVDPTVPMPLLVPDLLSGRWVILRQDSPKPTTYGYPAFLDWNDRNGQRFVLYFPDRNVLWDPLEGTISPDGPAGFGNWTGTTWILTRSSFNPAGVYRTGQSGKGIADLQQLLNATGQVNLPITARYGMMTEGAVKDFQKRANLNPDGVAGQETNLALLEESKVEFTWAPQEIENFIESIRKR